MILNAGPALERPTFPVNPLLVRVPGPRLAAIPDCRTIQGMVRLLQETFSNDCPDTTERRESDMKRESLDTSVPLPHFQSGDGMLNHTADSDTLRLMGSPAKSRIKVVLSSKTLPRFDSGLPRNTQNCTGIMGNVFERPLVQEGQPSTVFNNSMNLASYLWIWDISETARREMKRESLNTPTQSPHFQSRSGLFKSY